MNLLGLPQDILMPVLELLTQHDAVQLARTSRAAHTLSMPRVLSQVELGRFSLRDYSPGAASRHIASFTSLVLRNADAYAKHIKAITIYSDDIVPEGRGASGGYVDVIPPFVEVLRLASNLRKLHIHKAESLLALSPELVDVVVHHVRLQELGLKEVGGTSLSLLGRMNVGLRKVVLQEVRGRFDFDCLRRHIGTLEVFRLKELKDEEDLRPPCDGDVWEHVHTLELSGFWGQPPITSLPRAFPRVRDLSMKTSLYQSVILEEAHKTPFAWPSLEVLEIAHVWLNLITSVRVLHVNNTHVNGFPPQFFEHLQPAVLSLQLYDETAWFPSIRAASASLRTLRYLQLRRWDGLTWWNNETEQVTKYSFMATLQNLAELRLPLRAISLCHAERYSPEDDLPAAQESTASAVAGLFPTVELVGFGYHESASGMPRDYSPTVWYRVARTRTEDGDSIVVEVAHSAETAAITQYVENLDRTA